MPVVGTDAASAAPLDGAWLRSAMLVPGGLWTDLRIVPETGSTNSDVSTLARDGAPQGLVIAAETQVSGRGRRGRSWQSLPGAALTFSVLLRPSSVPQAARGWVPLLAGLATATAIRAVTTADARLKWPNDILVGDGKLAGILAEQHGDAIVVGIGLNVLGLARDLPVATATSLELLGNAGTDRTQLLAQILRQLEHWYSRWCETSTGDADGCGLRPEYLRLSQTVGRQVRVELPGDRSLNGTVQDVDGAGRLIVRPVAVASGTELIAVSAGDVIHVR